MSIEMIKEGVNGQLEFDFDALEAITSKEFVYEIKWHMKFGGGKNKNLYVITQVEGLVSVFFTSHYLSNGDMRQIHSFVFNCDKNTFSHSRMSSWQIDVFKELGVF